MSGSLESVLADFLQRQEAGNAPSPEQVLVENPQHASALRSFFANHFWLTSTASPPGATLVGQTLDDFQLIREIARGGMGVVYEAIQLSLGRTVAIKLIGDGILATQQMRVRFRLEAESAALLSHPNILPIHCIGCWQGAEYFVMPHVRGESLQSWVLRRGQQLSQRPETKAETLRMLRWTLGIVRDVARGVAYAHQRGIIHRDLKPENILMDDGVPRIVDFGLAKWHRDSPQLTSDGQVLGTPQYMSPEQARGLLDITDASDIYCLGGILLALLTGAPPHRGRSVAEVLASVVNDEPPSLRMNWPGGMPRLTELVDVDTILARAMAASPVDRYRSADDMADDLDRVLAGEPPFATPDGLVRRMTRELVRDSNQSVFEDWGRALRRIGTVIFVAHVAMFLIGHSDQWWSYFAPRFVMLLVIAIVIHRSRAGVWMPRLSPERVIWSIWIGYLASLAVINGLAVFGFLSRDSILVLACVNSGFAFQAMAGHIWGGNAILGLMFFVAAGLSAMLPDHSPLFLGSMWLVSMWVLGGRYDAAKRPPDTTPESLPHSAGSD